MPVLNCANTAIIEIHVEGVSKMSKGPCYQCPDRESGCHGKCERYAKFQEENETIKQRKREIAEFKDYKCQVFTRMYKKVHNKWVRW